MTIYGPHKASLKAVMDGFARGIRAYSEKTGPDRKSVV